MSREQPLFTVATIAYNSGKWIRQAIESVLSSSFNDFELLISDDCSNDDTWDIIQEYSDPRIKAWKNEKNIGEYQNRNKILSLAKGKYFLFVDGDDILYHKTLRNLSEYIQEFPDAASVWGVPSAAFWFALLPYKFTPEITTRLIYETKIHLAEIGFAETLFKTDILKMIGGFPDKISIGDTFVKKVIATKFTVVFVPMGFMLWRISDGQASRKLQNLDGAGYENFLIDQKILSEPIEGLEHNKQQELFLDVKSSFIKNLIRNMIKKRKFRQGVTIFRKLEFRFIDLRLLFRERELKYLPVDDISCPLIINHNS